MIHIKTQTVIKTLPDARYDPGYGDVIVSEDTEVGRGAIKNESYDDNYFDC